MKINPDEAAFMLKSGISQKDIAAHFNVSTAAVAQHFKRRGKSRTADSERLDWLEGSLPKMNLSDVNSLAYASSQIGIREAIDLARSKF